MSQTLVTALAFSDLSLLLNLIISLFQENSVILMKKKKKAVSYVT